MRFTNIWPVKLILILIYTYHWKSILFLGTSKSVLFLITICLSSKTNQKLSVSSSMPEASECPFWPLYCGNVFKIVGFFAQ